MRALAGAVLVLLLAPSAGAAEGVLEISQAAVDAAGGFPFVISQPGSYRLTSNLVLPPALPGVENTSAISITADGIRLDLAGFALLGPTRCTGGPPVTTCTPAGSGDGISAAGRSGVAIENGTVHGFGRDGIRLGRAGRVEGVHATSNADDGIELDDRSVVVGNVATENGDDGIFAQDDSTVAGNAARGNRGDGISVGAGSTAAENAVSRNGATGIRAIDATVRANAARRNEDEGILATDGSTVSRNAASDNGADGTGDGIGVGAGSVVRENAAYDNAGDGVQAALGSLASGNVARANTQVGLNLTSASAGFAGNVLSGNTVGTVAGGVEIGTNACGGSSTCP